MRAVLALVLAVTLGACGSDSSGDDGGGGDDGAVMDGAIPVVPPDLELTSPDVTIDPGQEVTFCWYFRTKNTKQLAINHWQSNMTTGSHHLILYTTPTDFEDPGTVSVVNCGAGTAAAVWTYSAQDPEQDLKLPSSDGAGKPLAMEILPNQAGFIQMHYVNHGDQPLQAHVTVRGYALARGVGYTRTAAYVTYNGLISIPPGTTDTTMPDVESMTCNVSPTSKFWIMSTHTHKRSVRVVVKDGLAANGNMIYESSDWEHPTQKRWDGPFYQFSTGKLTYECSYLNPTSQLIRTGVSAQTAEMCMASGYYFPATKPVFCYNNITN
jgi:hypothetical protein